MSLNYLSIDAGLIAHVGSMIEINISDYSRLVLFGLEVLEGLNVTQAMKDYAVEFEVNYSVINQMSLAVSALIWECAKLALKDSSALQNLLLQLGLNNTVVDTFMKVYTENRKRIMALKGSLGISTLSYKNMAWRLDVELSKRSLRVTTEPKYLLRFDLVNNSELDNIEDKSKSFHLQSDYANMKLLQNELQKAVDEFSNVHCQRLNKYIN